MGKAVPGDTGSQDYTVASHQAAGVTSIAWSKDNVMGDKTTLNQWLVKTKNIYTCKNMLAIKPVRFLWDVKWNAFCLFIHLYYSFYFEWVLYTHYLILHITNVQLYVCMTYPWIYWAADQRVVSSNPSTTNLLLVGPWSRPVTCHYFAFHSARFS